MSNKPDEAFEAWWKQQPAAAWANMLHRGMAWCGWQAAIASQPTSTKAGGWSAGQIERAWRSRHAFMTSGATSEMGWEDGERAGMAVALDSISGPPPTAEGNSGQAGAKGGDL